MDGGLSQSILPDSQSGEPIDDGKCGDGGGDDLRNDQ